MAEQEHHRPGLSRRRLLRGSTLIGAAGLGLTAAARMADHSASAAPKPAPSYPPLHWIPASPANYTVSNRPTAYPLDFVVIHVTQATFPNTMKIFKDPSSKVSAHYAIASADGYIGQFVREKDVAWHAGNWNHNTRSIGIEHEGWVDKPEYFTDALYRASATLTAAICDRYSIPKTRSRIIGHVEVPGTDHTDPGRYWDWNRYMRLVNAA
ncbi:N-acetylmuramoyl-L-alanine amidase [Streptomyces sp. NPDC050610]|uniref:N-acetylmuramoyl-L-alanine amidase n=1 Tax=Streptomyces sp. NPDC050610 TaxID=3157097 RepID=UPI00342F6609